jgi:hypothetical protein
MLYRFRSPATADTLMLGPQAEQFFRVLGREPAVRGIIEPAAMPKALQALAQAVEDDDAQRAATAGQDDAQREAAAAAAGRDPVSLRRRLWPMVEMLRRAQAAQEPVVWGV